MNPADTIVALSSAAGPAARMIVRTAGPAAFEVLRQLSPGFIPTPSSAARTVIAFADMSVPAWVYAFAGPRSYTGDDLVEYHLPGSPLLARLLIEAIVAAGARTAGPGEFTARAFLNSRLDLAAAEGVAMTIAATHEDELRAARQLMAGDLSRRLSGPLEMLTEALALVESNLDFAEEDISFIDTAEVRRRVALAASDLATIERDAAFADRPTGERSFVLVGLPNAGKSTLLNALAGTERAVVSPVAGTTRAALSADVTLSRGIVRVTDVAGLERGDDDIGKKMQGHARRAIEQADFVIEVRDGTSAVRAWLPREAHLVVMTKSDLPRADQAAVPAIVCSAKTSDGLPAVRAAMEKLAFGSSAGAATLSLTARHVGALRDARVALATIVDDSGGEIVAEALRRAVEALGGVIGRVSPDDVLERVFATFCVGK